MSNKLKIDHIAGWPKMLDYVPDRPHRPSIFIGDGPDLTDESDIPYDINWDLGDVYKQTGNVYAVIEAFISFHRMGLYPPTWALDYVAAAFEAHLDNPSPSDFAKQFGVSGGASGANSQFDDYGRLVSREKHLTEIIILLSGFRISFAKAAEIVQRKFDLEVAPKTLMNSYRRRFGDPKIFMLKHREFDPIKDPFQAHEPLRNVFLDTIDFPADREYLVSKAPDIK